MHLKGLQQTRLASARHEWVRYYFRPLDTLAIAVFAAGIISYRVWPLFFWCLPFLALISYGGYILAACQRRQRHILLGMLGVAFLFQLAYGLLVGLHAPLDRKVLSDDYGYFIEASAVAKAWSEGVYPSLSLKGSLPYLGTLHTGYQRFVAALFYILGNPNYRPAILANYVFLAMLPLFVFRAAVLLTPAPWVETGFATQLPFPLIAATLAGLYPSTAYWASFLLKDALLTVFFAGLLAATLETFARKRLWAGCVMLSLAFMVVIVRAYALFAVLAGAFFYVIAIIPRRWALWVTLTAIASLLAISYTTRGSDYLSQLVFSISVQLPEQARTLEGTVFYFLSAIPRLLLAPYAWVRAFGTNPTYEIYPGMWLLYLVIYPLGLMGLMVLVRNDVRLAVIPFVAWFSAGLILILAYAGDAPRQRLCLDVIWFVFAGCGQPPTRYQWVLVIFWFVGLAVYASIQLCTLRLRY